MTESAQDTVRRRLKEIGELPDNFDDNGAPAPSADSVRRASALLEWAIAENMNVDIGPDAMGGVGIYADGNGSLADRMIWFAFMNDGHDTLVASEDRNVIWSAKLDADSRVRALTFLTRTEE